MCKLGDIIVVDNISYIIADIINNELYTLKMENFIKYLEDKSIKPNIIKFEANKDYFYFAELDQKFLIDLIHFKENKIDKMT